MAPSRMNRKRSNCLATASASLRNAYLRSATPSGSHLRGLYSITVSTNPHGPSLRHKSLFLSAIKNFDSSGCFRVVACLHRNNHFCSDWPEFLTVTFSTALISAVRVPRARRQIRLCYANAIQGTPLTNKFPTSRGLNQCNCAPDGRALCFSLCHSGTPARRAAFTNLSICSFVL
jgi:hypothetical protein